MDCKSSIGYVNNPKTRNIDIDPVKAKIIVKLFKDFSEGKESVESLRARLSFYGIVNKRGGEWHKSAVY